MLSNKKSFNKFLDIFRIGIISCFYIFQSFQGLAQHSVLAQGDFYKIAVTETGVHKIDANFLKKAGIDITKINPQYLKIYGNGGAMLAQANATKRPTDLVENAILVNGEADGKFDTQDYVLFYGESPHRIFFDSTQKVLTHQINYYSDTTFYFLTIGNSQGLRIQQQTLSDTSSKTVVSTFDDFQFHELDQKNINNSGRSWYGEYFGSSGDQNFDINLTGVNAGTSVKINTSALSIANVGTTLKIKINNQLLDSLRFWAVSNGEFDVKGNEQQKNIVWKSDGSTTVKLSFSYDGKGQSSSGAYLNYYEIQANRKIQFNATQTIIRSLESTNYAITNFQVQQVQTTSKVWEITNPQVPSSPLLSLSGTVVNFSSATKNQLKTFVLFDDTNVLTPKTIRKIENQDLQAAETPDLLIVTPKAFKAQAEELAVFRRSNDSLKVLVATVETINNEFASGKTDVTAIRDFARFLWKKNPQQLKYLLLFGDASFDYKNKLQVQGVDVNNLVSVYESRESLDPIYSYSSDDYFGFFKETDGEWVESYEGDQLLDIGVGRLPVKSTDEAEATVQKIINYANPKNTVGKWRGQISFVADDGDFNLHQLDAEGESNLVQSKNQEVSINKIYLDAYPQISTPNGAIAPQVNKAIAQAVDNGSLIINYNGHGSETGWAEEQILTIAEIQNFKNINNLPLFLTATCQFGRYDNPTLVSGAELTMLNRSGGAIGLLTTTRPVYASSNFILNQAFYNALFASKNIPRLGDIMKATKNNSLSGPINRNFALLGDPSMCLNYPKQRILITKINNVDVVKDTLKALGTYKIEGEIQNTAAVMQKQFNGTVFVSVFDKPSQLKTLGAKGVNGLPMNYSTYKNKIFEGRATVQQGKFQINVTVPKDIVYTLGKGRIQCYAINADSTNDAIGSTNAVWVGGSVASAVVDTTPPTVQLFLNTEDFKNGGSVGANPVLIAKISDNAGINLSHAGIGHEMLLTLNDTLKVVVNDYYSSNTDDYKNGVLIFPFQNLPVGQYTVRLKTWDVYNNSTEVSLNFKVIDEPFKISNIKAYPNPFQSQVNFEIEQNRAGDDLLVEFNIYDAIGKKFLHVEKNYYHCDSILKDFSVSGESLGNATYYYQFVIRSLTENVECRAGGRLIHFK